MGFLNPAVLGLLGLAGIPVVIHLLNRRRHRVVPWAAMAFLLAAQQETKRRLRMEDLLLLLLRTAAVLCFALAAARPFLPSAAAAAGIAPDRTHLYLLVDTSASMGAREGMTTLLAKAVAAARSEIGALRSDDPVTVVLSNDRVRRRNGRPVDLVKNTRDHDKALAALAQAERTPSFARMDPAASLAAVLAAAEPSDQRRRLVVLSDFQRADWAPSEEADGPDAPPGAAPGPPGAGSAGGAALRAQAEALRRGRFQVALRPVGAGEPEDLSVVSLGRPGGRLAVEDAPVSFEAAVANGGPAPVSATVSLTVDGVAAGSRRVTIPGRSPGGPPGTARAEFPWSGRAGGRYASVEVSGPGDRLAAGNERGHAFAVRERVRVLAYDGDPDPGAGRFPETGLLTLALSLERGVAPVEVEVLRGEEISRVDPAGRDVVVLANLDRVPDEAWERLGAFVRRGGGLLVFLGERTDPLAWNQAARAGPARDLAPALLEHRPRLDAGSPVPVDLSPSRHPVLAEITDPRHGTAFEAPLVSGWWPVLEPLPEGAAAALRLRDLARSPVLVERAVGRGRVLLCTTTADMDWMGPSLLFAPLVQETVAWLAAAGEERRDARVLEPLVVPVPDAASDVAVTDPEGQRRDDLVAVPRVEGEAAALGRVLVFAETDTPGRYRASWKAPAADGSGPRRTETVDLAVNIDPRETDLARARPEALQRRFPAFAVGDLGAADAAAAAADAAGSGDLAPALLLGGTVLLLLETFFAARVGRRRR